jgi:two-component system, NarL family, response regulator NreC
MEWYAYDHMMTTTLNENSLPETGRRMSTQISILLADDHTVLRSGLRNLFDQQKDMRIVGEADDGRKAVEMAKETSPNVVVMDISMPELNGVEATRQIVSEVPGAKVIALSAHTDRRFVVEALKAGAVGYLPKVAPFEELTTAIRTVASGKIYLSPRVANVVIEDYVRGGSPEQSSAFSTLSPREREVLQLIAEGFATKEVARHLHVSVKTVETHRARTMEKLKLDSVAELTKYAIREGITSLGD